RTMKRISVSYVYYFNKKYRQIGHLFQDRYRSEAVEEDSYILGVVRYIHNNPIRAGMVSKAEEYQWSSYRDYINGHGQKFQWLETNFILSMLSDKKETAIGRFKEFSRENEEENQFIDDGVLLKGDKGTEENVNYEIARILKNSGQSLENFKNCKDKKKRNFLLRQIKEETNYSIRELSTILGISKDMVFRA
ncbi:transposase, partial [Anaerosolibacter sp.]|uniref:transposase n=1 Tax=Anaerosolibacter sp. TaxID=1872527 RepID=UPI0039EEF95C